MISRGQWKKSKCFVNATKESDLAANSDKASQK
jgi:hypothetical protein